ncbi:hypothetical protein AAER40_27660, partial [Klebsiella pneumoniae]|uniref:hypothetical protein n=1 Tax=Klebsiella pneumoniae TaxID=573 RepID=UPI003136E042
GYLVSTDWTLFNAKESALTFTSPLNRSVNTISLLAASGAQDGYLASADYSMLQSLGTGYSNGQIPIGNAGSFTKANLTAGNFITITNSAGAIAIKLNDTGFSHGDLLIGDTGLNGGAGGVR